MVKKINILGTEYDYMEKPFAECGFEDKTIDGEHSMFDKTIKVVTDPYRDSRFDDKPLNQQAYIDKNKRHEIIHAYFATAGANQYNEENLVEFLAIQFPKMLATFNEVGAL